MQGDGYCYLSVFPREYKQTAQQKLGQWPKIDDVHNLFVKLRVDPKQHTVTYRRVSTSRYHLELDHEDGITFDSLFRLLPPGSRVGGRYTLGQFSLVTAPDYTLHVIIVIMCVIALTYPIVFNGCLAIGIIDINALNWMLISDEISLFVGVLLLAILGCIALRLHSFEKMYVGNMNNAPYTDIVYCEGMNSWFKLQLQSFISPWDFSATEPENAILDCITDDDNRENSAKPNTLKLSDAPTLNREFKIAPSVWSEPPYADGNKYKGLIKTRSLADDYTELMDIWGTRITELDGNFADLKVSVDKEETETVTRSIPLGKLYVNSTISSENLNVIKRNFPEFEIEAERSVSCEHPVAAATRQAHTNKVYHAIGAGKTVLDVGSTVANIPLNGVTCLVCNIDAKDPCRLNKISDHITKEKSRYLHRLVDFNKMEHHLGKYNSMVLSFVHDIPLKTIVFNAHRMQVQEIYITLHATSSVLCDAVGFLRNLNVKFAKYATKKGVIIEYLAMDSDARTYTHDFTNIRDILEFRVIKLAEDAYYVSEVLYQGGDATTIIMNFTTRLPENTQSISLVGDVGDIRLIGLFKNNNATNYGIHFDTVTVEGTFAFLVNNTMAMIAGDGHKKSITNYVSSIQNLVKEQLLVHYNPLFDGMEYHLSSCTDIVKSLIQAVRCTDEIAAYEAKHGYNQAAEISFYKYLILAFSPDKSQYLRNKVLLNALINVPTETCKIECKISDITGVCRTLNEQFNRQEYVSKPEVSFDPYTPKPVAFAYSTVTAETNNCLRSTIGREHEFRKICVPENFVIITVAIAGVAVLMFGIFVATMQTLVLCVVSAPLMMATFLLIMTASFAGLIRRVNQYVSFNYVLFDSHIANGYDNLRSVCVRLYNLNKSILLIIKRIVVKILSKLEAQTVAPNVVLANLQSICNNTSRCNRKFRPPVFANVLGMTSRDFSSRIFTDLSQFNLTSFASWSEIVPNCGDLVECLYENAPYVSRQIATKVYPNKESLANAIIRSVDMVVIYRNVLMHTKPGLTKITKDSIIVRLTEKLDFTRMIVSDITSFNELIESYAIIDIQSNDIRELIKLGRMRLKSAPTKHCGYHALYGSDFRSQLTGQLTELCEPEEMRHGMHKVGAIIYHEANAYYPRGTKYSEIVKVIVVIGTHAFIPQESNAVQLAMASSILPETDWNLPINGTIVTETRLEDLIKSSSLVKTLLDKAITERSQSIYEILLYIIENEMNLWKKFKLIGEDVDKNFLRATTEASVYDRKLEKFVNGKPEKVFKYAWNGKEVVEVTYDPIGKRYSAEVLTNFFLFSDELELMREFLILKNLDLFIKLANEPRIEEIETILIEGVPGSGKSTEIYSLAEPEDIICTGTRAAKDDYLKRKDATFDERIRTYDSVMMHGGVKSLTLYADEGLMVHAGELLLAALLCDVDKIKVYGDGLQIPWIPRLIGFMAKHHKLAFTHKEMRNITYRLPKNMERIMKQFYKDIVCVSNIEGEMAIIKIHKPSLLVGYDVVVTFTQFEKSVMEFEGNQNVRTAHECQGNTFKKVALVRFVRQDNMIYSSQPHIIVACSRHTELLHYLTVDENDTVCKILNCKNVVLHDESKVEYDKTAVYYGQCCVPKTIWRIRKFGKMETKPSFWSFIRTRKGITSGPQTEIRSLTYIVDKVKPFGFVRDVSHVFAQAVYNCLFEDVMSWKQESFDNQPLNLSISGIKTNFAKLMGFEKKQNEYCKPLLKTIQPKRLLQTPLETLNAAIKRNLGVPKLNYVRPVGLEDSIVDNFMSVFVDQNKLTTANAIFNFGSDFWFEDWLSKRTGAEIKRLEGLGDVVYDQTRYYSHVKPSGKAVLDNTHNLQAPAGQVLTAHNPLVTAEWSGTMRCFTEKLKYILKDKWIINDGMNSQEVEGRINKILCKVVMFLPMEIDFSKFDKSQEEIVLNSVCLLMLRLGVSKKDVDEWRRTHIINILVFSGVGIKITTQFQRRSGDVLTFLGNVLVAMMAISYLHDLSSAIGGIFGGDDSLIFFHNDYTIVDQSERMAQIFNLTAKLEFYPTAMYFSSKYLILIEGIWRLIPCPIKAFTKLGRDDIYSKEHAELYHESFADNFECYLNENVRNKLNEVTMIRFKKVAKNMPSTCIDIIDFLSSLVKNKNKFLSLYSADRKTWNRKMPESMRKREMRAIDFLTIAELMD